MLKAFSKLWNDERGNALIIVAASLPLIMGSVGLASDTIQWTLWKRELQRAADSAAIAGVYALVRTNDHENAVARDLEHNNAVASFTIDTDIENSPATGAFTADPMAVRVLLAARKELNFSSMFMQAAPTIRASATATIVPDGKYCVISLETTSETGISVGGTANVDLGCGMITNSSSMNAALAFGDSEVNASPIAAVGGIEASDNWAADVKLRPLQAPQKDPFADTPAPTPTGCQGFNSYDTGNNNRPGRVVDLSAQTGTICIKEPGGSLEIKGDVRLGSATYVLDATSLKMTNASARLSCTGCTIILTSSTAATTPSSIGNVSIQGGDVDMSAPDDGTYAGIIFYQDRRALNGTGSNYQNLINGNASSSFTGAFYFPNQQTTFTGTAGMSTACMQLVARRVIFSGNAAISNTCDEDGGSGSFDGQAVRLVE